MESDYMPEVEDPVYRMRMIMDPYRLSTRNEFRQAWENLLSRYGDQPDDNPDPDAG